MARRLASAFRSIGVRNFRLFAAGQLVSVAGTWMMVVAQDWLVLDLADNSGTVLGLVTALQFTPLLLFTLIGGRLADRHDRRALLTAVNALSGLLALGLAALVFTGAVRVWHIALTALCLGLLNAVEIPTRMSFVGELVGAELLPNASALSAAYFSVARVAGPALAGILITGFGTGWAMLANAVSYAGTVTALRMMRPTELHRAPQGEGRTGVLDGLRHLGDRPDLRIVLALSAVVSLFGMNFQLTLPLLAKTVLHADAGAFGLVTTAFAAGSLGAALATTGRRSRPSGPLVAGAAAVFGALETAAGLASTYVTAAVLLFCTGFASMYVAQAANHRIQLGTDPAYRGRVLALYTLVSQGTVPFGALGVGRLTEYAGARSGLWLGGLVSLAAGVTAGVLERRRGGGGVTVDEGLSDGEGASVPSGAGQLADQKTSGRLPAASSTSSPMAR